MAQQHDTGSGTLATLVTGAVLGAAGLAWWLLNEADRRRRYGAQEVDVACSADAGRIRSAGQLSERTS